MGNLVYCVPSARGALSGCFHYLFELQSTEKCCFCSTSATHFPRSPCAKCRQNCVVYNDSLTICPATDARLSHLMTVPCTVIAEKSVVFIYLVNCSWVDSWWQYHSTHLHTNNTQNNTTKQNTQNGTYITIRIHKHNNKIHKHYDKNT